ncbi:hypothetical protein KFU94_68050 [Chloroflexi bacterium TSY]|nr:hypothetical protein [Chloroflexi bacterium TSY]
MGRIWRHWGMDILIRCTPAEFEQLVTICGQENLQKAQEERKGIILARAHMVLSSLIGHWLNQNGFSKQTNIGQINKIFQKRNIETTKFAVSFEIARQVMQAKKALAHGGVAHILPDGYRGSGGLPLPFCQRHHEFRTGFADLALTTGAAVIPAFVSLDLNGHIEIQFSKPLDVGPTTMEQGERVELLIRQYATLLEKHWREEPWLISWQWIEKYLELPESIPNTILTEQVQVETGMANTHFQNEKSIKV